MDRRSHWEAIYSSRRPDEVSWFQARAVTSLELILAAAPERDTAVLDVGAGASRLVDDLLGMGYRDLTVLDLSGSAIRTVRDRLGSAASGVAFVEGDVTTMDLSPGSVGLWHDRAVFHFLTDPEDRRRYLRQVRRAVVPGGFALVATFAADGPLRCSGLEVCRYDPEQLHATFGPDFQLVESRREEHHTPSGGVQAFTYCLCRYRPGSARRVTT